MDDIVLVTVDSVRRDYVQEMDFVSSHGIIRGTAAGHYTRPSLASLISSRYEASLEKSVVGPSLPMVLSDAGYTCIGLVPTPQADPVFGFDQGFDYFKNFYDAGNRGKTYRDYLAQFTILRKLYHRVAPPQAKMDRLPRDSTVIDEAVEQFNTVDEPRFLWLHLMETHRPYGRENNGISKQLDRKALFSPGKLTETEHDEILSKYRAALRRTDTRVENLLNRLDSSPIFIFVSDHGDEFGEDSRYFHQPQRRRVADALIEVPIVFDGMDLDSSWMSLIDLAPSLIGGLGFDIPDAWDGVDHMTGSRNHAITIAPWLDKATVSYQNSRVKLTANEANISLMTGDRKIALEGSMAPEKVKDRLRSLGYVG
jgi:arylsulfatase A-like enzyme